MKYLPQFSNALEKLEIAIVEKWGKDKLVAWRGEEFDYKKDVVNPEKHAKLKNPYDLEGTLGQCYNGSFACA